MFFGRRDYAASVTGRLMTTPAIEALFEESRRFPPPPEFAAQANATADIYAEAERDYAAFWASWARTLEWIKPFTVTLEWNEPFARWFGDGELNVSVNCLDRHVTAGDGEKIAYYYEGEPGDRRSITYRELLDEVNRFANGLRSLGIRRGDRVAIYMPMILELPVAMLAFAGIDRRPCQRCTMRRADYGRLRLAAGCQGSAQAQLRCRDGAHPDGKALHRSASNRRRRLHARGTRLLVERGRRGTVRRVRTRGDERRRPALPPVHERYDG